MGHGADAFRSGKNDLRPIAAVAAQRIDAQLGQPPRKRLDGRAVGAVTVLTHLRQHDDGQPRHHLACRQQGLFRLRERHHRFGDQQIDTTLGERGHLLGKGCPRRVRDDAPLPCLSVNL